VHAILYTGLGPRFNRALTRIAGPGQCIGPSTESGTLHAVTA
jgi:hypothetical protein